MCTFLPIHGSKTAKCVTNTVDSNQTPRSVVSDLGLHCFSEAFLSENVGGKYGKILILHRHDNYACARYTAKL